MTDTLRDNPPTLTQLTELRTRAGKRVIFMLTVPDPPEPPQDPESVFDRRLTAAIQISAALAFGSFGFLLFWINPLIYFPAGSIALGLLTLWTIVGKHRVPPLSAIIGLVVLATISTQ